ncbi:unnamed protein product [Urochloa decumbens]|uniref:Serpin domain-containing protein n=1 Tax=Urochloa decumbens TaxID=240449 RepID=A0ABC9B4E8_9POAL
MARKRRRAAETTERRTNRAGMTALSLCLTKHLAPAADGDDGGAADDPNLAFSPASIYAVLSLLATGAGGGTLQELLAALGGESRDDLAAFARGVAEGALADRSRAGGPVISFACGAWHDAAWATRPEFREAVAAAFKAETSAVDFSHEPEKAVKDINASVAAATNKRINSIVDATTVNNVTRLVVASAIYFKGKWEAPFAKSHTTVGKFHRLDGSAADVPFMRSSRSQLVAVRNGYKVLKLPYKSPAPPPSQPRRKGRRPTSQKKAGDEKGGDEGAGEELPKYSMCIFLPDERDGLAGLVEKLASGAGFWHYRLPADRVPVGDFRLPKFKLSASGSLKQLLREDMGINAAFVPGDADMSDMAERKEDEDEDGTPMHVGDVCHKAVLEVNEEGTMTMAATGSAMLCGVNAVMEQPETVDFVADHPFVFFVIEEVSRAIVLVGRVLDPSVSG